MQRAETGLEFFQTSYFLKDDSEPEMQQLFSKIFERKGKL